MEGHVNTRKFFAAMLAIFIPTSVRLKILGFNGTDEYYIRFSTYTAKGTAELKSFINSSTRYFKIKEVEISTVAGTIREHSASYGRKKCKSVTYMNMKLDLLPIRKKSYKIQKVRLSTNKLERDSDFIPELPLTNIRKIWHENSKSPIDKMPNTVANIVQMLTTRDRLSPRCKK